MGVFGGDYSTVSASGHLDVQFSESEARDVTARRSTPDCGFSWCLLRSPMPTQRMQRRSDGFRKQASATQLFVYGMYVCSVPLRAWKLCTGHLRFHALAVVVRHARNRRHGKSLLVALCRVVFFSWCMFRSPMPTHSLAVQRMLRRSDGVMQQVSAIHLFVCCMRVVSRCERGSRVQAICGSMHSQ